MFDSPEAPIEGEVDKWGFTIKPAISDTDLIIMCLKNAPCGADRKQVDRLVKHYENGEDSILKLYQHLGMNKMERVEITPQTYIDMNKEFEEEDYPFRITVPTQETIDKWQSQPSPPYQTPPPIDMVAEMWAEHNRIEEERKLQLELDL